jgi:hypothetical protein
MTTNEQFRINSLRNLATEAADRAADARTIANALGDAYVTCKGDDAAVRAAGLKYHQAQQTAVELERKCYDATVRAFYAALAVK